jgi:RNA polymerase sigma-70 factor, ECF subfamily
VHKSLRYAGLVATALGPVASYSDGRPQAARIIGFQGRDVDEPAALRKKAIAAEVPRLMRYARALLHDRQDAEDLVHDCIVRALANLTKWREGDSPRQWLLTIMHNVHIDQIRSRARRPLHLPLEDWDNVRATSQQAGDVMGVEIERALAALPHEQRQCVLLVGLEGLSYAEAADVLGVPVGTVMSRLSRGRENLRQRLDPTLERPSLRRIK